MRMYLRMGLALAVCLAPSAALAFVPTGFTAPQPSRYEVNANSAQELGRDTALQVVSDSYANWSAPACSGYRSEFTGETDGSWRSGDGMNTLIWIYDRNQRPRELGGRATIGVTLSLTQGRRAVDGDILFNGIDHSWTTNAVRQGQVDAVSIITHEVGHQLGLNHSPLQSATMYAAYLGGDSAASLAADDINGVCDLYPSGAEPDCSRDSDCADGQSCVGGTCLDGPAPGEAGIGDSCMPGDCAEGLFCVQEPGGSTFCTRECQGECPNGWACERVQLGGQVSDICLPGQGGAAGDGNLGDPCQSAADCAVGFCVSDGQNTFCSQACSEDGDCPEGAMCLGTQGGGGACVPGNGGGGGGAGFGEVCRGNQECASGLCVQSPQGAFCTELCQDSRDCPANGDCLEATNGQGVCVPNGEPAGAGFGDGCGADDDCESGLCVRGANGSFCTEACGGIDECPIEADDCVTSDRGDICLPEGESLPMSGGAGGEGGGGGPIGGSGGGLVGGGGSGGGGSGTIDINDPETNIGVGAGCACSTSQTNSGPWSIFLGFMLLGIRGTIRRRKLRVTPSN